MPIPYDDFINVFVGYSSTKVSDALTQLEAAGEVVFDEPMGAGGPKLYQPSQISVVEEKLKELFPVTQTI